MNSKEPNTQKEKEEKVANNIAKTRQSYPQPKPEKPSNEDIRRQLGWHLK